MTAEHPDTTVEKVVAVLLGKPKKYTVHIGLTNGQKLEVQQQWIPTGDLCSHTHQLVLRMDDGLIPWQNILYVVGVENP